jgi:hypothetical protein
MAASELDPWKLFLNAMRSPVTRDRYSTRVAKFFDFTEIPGRTLEQRAKTFAKKGKKDTNWALSNILKFVYFQRERVDKKEISGATVMNYTKSIKLFCDMADIPIQWKKITRGLPRGKRYTDDRIPTLEELKKLVEYPDRRIMALVYTMASSGFRVGAWDYLRWSHIRPVEKNGQVIAAKMIVYAAEDEEYFTFISPIAWRELSRWRQYRESSGEPLNSDELKEKLEKEINLVLSKEEINAILHKLMPDIYETYNIRLLRWAQIFYDSDEKKYILTTLSKYITCK